MSMPFEQAKSTVELLGPKIAKLKKQLKVLNAKMKPAREVIDAYVVAQDLGVYKIGSVTFKPKTKKELKLGKKRFTESSDIPEAVRCRYIENNTEENTKVEVTFE
jgi:hypothetical protein